MTTPDLRLYAALARLPRPKSYQGKILLVALAGTLVPLVTLLAYVVATAGMRESLPALGVALAATLAGTAATAYALHRLLAPVAVTSGALRAYLDDRRRPALPTEFTDDVGLLMAGTQRTIEKLDEVIVHLASYDRLTALPNRALFRDRLQQAVAQARREARPVTVILLDVDGFADVNTAWGQAGGDRLLAAVAQRLATCTRESDVLARVGGDEFAIASIGQPGADPVDVQARRVVEAMSRPFNVEGREVVVSASVGVTVFPTDDGSVEQLIGNASAAARAARRSGGNTYRFYSAELDARLQRRLALETDLRHALERGQLFLHYQPKVEAATGRVRGVEALARWHHPERGLIPPMEFIPIAEESGLIVPIGEWVLRTACTQLMAWIDAGLPAVPVSVNLSARQFARGDLVATVRRAMFDSGIDPSLLELEVTESLLMDDTVRAAQALEALRGDGVLISLDDFGTGYSSLAYLKNFPIDTIKVDQSFIRDVAHDAGSGAIATAIIGLAHSLGLDVVAEGVETAEQLAFLVEHECDTVQGFYFSRPVPADRVAKLLVSGLEASE
jgi:diguanylate cyclase (GGDEF)-like protein